MYERRFDGRKFDELRPVKMKVDVVPSADGSAVVEMGNTKVIASVFGPKPLHPKHLQNPEKGVLRCYYDMMSFSVPERKRPGPTRRSTEISMVMRNALASTLLLEEFPKAVVDVFVEVYEANAGTRCASITAASLALADAGVPMRDLVSAVAVGKVGGKIVLDLTKEEEDHPEGATDIPIAMVGRSGKITALQLDGAITKEELKKALELGKKGCSILYEMQRRALKAKYGVR